AHLLQSPLGEPYVMAAVYAGAVYVAAGGGYAPLSEHPGCQVNRADLVERGVGMVALAEPDAVARVVPLQLPRPPVGGQRPAGEHAGIRSDAADFGFWILDFGLDIRL